MGVRTLDLALEVRRYRILFAMKSSDGWRVRDVVRPVLVFSSLDILTHYAINLMNFQPPRTCKTR